MPSEMLQREWHQKLRWAINARFIDKGRLMRREQITLAKPASDAVEEDSVPERDPIPDKKRNRRHQATVGALISYDPALQTRCGAFGVSSNRTSASALPVSPLSWLVELRNEQIRLGILRQ